jgi:hypothetical protein
MFGKGGRVLLADCGDECAGETGRQDGTSEREAAESLCQLAGRGALEEDSVGAGTQGGAGGFVSVVRGQHQDPGGESAAPVGVRSPGTVGGSGDAAYGLEVLLVRLTHVDENNIGPEVLNESDGLATSGRLAHDREVGLGFQMHAQAETLQGLVVDDEYGGHAGFLRADRTLKAFGRPWSGRSLGRCVW